MSSATTCDAQTDQTRIRCSPGQILGNRHRIEALLGRGGMGEVWLAFDLRLRVEVALKSVLDDRLVHREVLAAREVISPNVCRVFDLIQMDGQEFVSMEYIDGQTLRQMLETRGRLELRDAGEIASQLLAGLEAIHRAGLVHRDVKPGNIMLTRAGRVVVMDFGLASHQTENEAGVGRISGTPNYMAPEQARGDVLDSRADVFATGIVLSEMVGGTRSRDRSALPETPWRAIITRALAPDRGERFASAGELARALEEVTVRADRNELKSPYPGLASFNEEDAEFFFGREAEVEALWKKLYRAHLLAVVGPSGSGKSSFLNAGVVPVMPDGWSRITLRPGDAPFDALAHALGANASEPWSDAVDRWRRRHREVLLIVDQFEELFTQNAPEVQSRFADVLALAANKADVHVLLGMRDDFLLRCHEHAALAPIFSDLTPLGPPTGGALRRALVQPALACGYRFEDETTVEAMLSEVTRERGALPLIAFAASRVWESRDRETGLLRRAEYDRIGGVGGALAQHAEETMARIGAERESIVRELLRNLVTARGTRLARNVDDLLSLFDSTTEAAEAAPHVLQTLIDARLLTSFEIDDTRRVEIVHESLLHAWPRLARWRRQDAEGAQLRDELRHAATLWDQKGRPLDLLWIGTAFQEFLLWRERYPGALTATEDAFATAASDQAERQTRRRRRIAASAVLALLVITLAVVGAFWRQAVGEARRAEAARLLALARLELEADPTAAIAHAIASLEFTDSADVRRLVLEALWKGPTRFELCDGWGWGIDFSPDGQWLAVSNAEVVRSGADDRSVRLERYPPETMELGFAPGSDLLAVTLGADRSTIGIWSLPGGRLSRTLELEADSFFFFTGKRSNARLLTESLEPTRLAVAPDGRDLLACFLDGMVRVIPLDDGPVRELRGFSGVLSTAAAA